MTDFEELKISIIAEGTEWASRFLELILNKGLSRIPDIIQTGGKAGQSLKAHIQNVVCFSYHLGQLAKLNDNEMINLTAAAYVHDLNKFPEHEGRPSYSTIATKENVEKLLACLIQEAEDDYELTYDVIVDLICAHNVFGHVDGASLFASAENGPIKVSKYLLKAADTLDMSHFFHERSCKDKALRLINGVVGDTQYEFTWHYFSDNRGMFTNLVHNSLIDLYREKGGIPLLFYPEGVWYLIPKGNHPSITTEEATMKLQGILKRIRTEDPSKLLEDAKGVGAKFADNPFDLNLSASRILDLLMSYIAKAGDRKFDDKFEKLRNQSPAKCFKKYRERMKSASTFENFQKKKKSLQNALERAGLSFENIVASGNIPAEAAGKKTASLKKILREYQLAVQKFEAQKKFTNNPLWEDVPVDLFSSEKQAMHLGYLCGSFALLLNNHLGCESDYAWNYAARVPGLTENEVRELDFFNTQRDQSYRIGALLYERGITIAQARERYIAFLEERFPYANKSELDTEFYEYICSNFSYPESGVSFTNNSLREYIRHNHSQCCHCGNGIGQKWMATKLPQKIKSQLFSNRLKGGGGEPKRNVCKICEESFMVEKIACELYDNHYYIHLVSDGGEHSSHAEPAIFLKGLKDGIEKLRKTDTRSFFVQPYKIMQSYLKEEAPVLQGKLTKQTGILIPKFSETIGGQITISINPPTGKKTSHSTQFLFNLSHLLILTRFFSLRGILSKSSVPPLNSKDFNKIFIDHIPLPFRGIIPENDMDAAGYKELWEKILSLYALRSTYNSWKDDEIVALCRTLFDDTGLTLFHYLKTQYRKNIKGDKKPWSKAWPHLKPFMKEEAFMPIKKLAEIALENHFHGGSWSDTSQAKPLDLAFDVLLKHKAPETLEDLKMIMLHDVIKGLERVSQFKNLGKKRNESVREFVDVFFDELLSGRYSIEKARMMQDQKRIRAAFLGYLTVLREQKKTDNNNIKEKNNA